jgi:hypothetical protein
LKSPLLKKNMTVSKVARQVQGIFALTQWGQKFPKPPTPAQGILL